MIIAAAPDTVADAPIAHPAPLAVGILDSLPDPVWVIDGRDKIVGWNQAAERTYGLSAEFAIGQSVLLFIPHDSLIEYARASEAVRREGKWLGDLVTRTTWGEARLVEARWGLAGERGDPNSLVIAHQIDVTERRERQAEADRASRWTAIRALSGAVSEEVGSCEARDILTRFAHGADPTECRLHRGAGELVLVVCFRPLVRELIRGLLLAAGYQPLIATDLIDASRLTAQLRDRLRAAVLGCETDFIGVAAELRRFQPILPLVPIGSVPEPSTFLESVAEAVADSVLAESGLLL